MTYEYDNQGNLKKITQGSEITTIEYDENNRRKSLTYPNGIIAIYGYDNAGRLTGIHYAKGATAIESLSYTYDPSGNVIQRIRTGAASKQESAKDASYDPRTNRLLSLNGETFIYDDNGNLTTRTNSCGVTNYRWDSRNRLIGIQGFKPDCSALTANFVYDALGRRVQRTFNGSTTTYLYDDLDVIAEMGQTNVHYLRTDTIDQAVARYTTGEERYYLTDLLQSSQELTDKQGNAQTAYSYSPFGEMEFAGESNDNIVQYTGRENDNIGLYYYRARYYAPGLARFISEDPIGYESGLNLYIYVENNPLAAIDPLGLQARTTPRTRIPQNVHDALQELPDGRTDCINIVFGCTDDIRERLKRLPRKPEPWCRWVCPPPGMCPVREPEGFDMPGAPAPGCKWKCTPGPFLVPSK